MARRDHSAGRLDEFSSALGGMALTLVLFGDGRIGLDGLLRGREVGEFNFRYNRRAGLKITDTERHDQLLAMIEGKRFTYRRIGEAGHA